MTSLTKVISNKINMLSGCTAKILVPPSQKGMKILNKSAFTKIVQLPTILVPDLLIYKKMKEMRPFLLRVPGVKPVADIENTDNNSTSENKIVRKKLFLNPERVKIAELEDLVKFIRTEMKLDEEIAKSAQFEFVEFSYNNWTWIQVLNSILPDDQEKVSGFSHVGHVLHLNLRDHLLPYKTIIAEVLLEKISQSKTVVNKLNVIDNTYRNFQMEILAGEANTVVSVKQNLCQFEFDFAKVYWNPRLCAEHERIIKMLQPGDVLFDVFAGVGPFSIPIGKKKCFVLANDLNPESFRWLQHNVNKNKIPDKVQCFNKDGRDFIRQDVAAYIQQKLNNPEEFDFKVQKFHLTMNLPAIAAEFLDSFNNLMHVGENIILPPEFSLIVHVYCFIKDIEGYKEKALQLVEEKLAYKLPAENVLEVSFVRNVAPNKEMLRVSFKMPNDILESNSNCESKLLKRKHSEIQ